MTMFGMIEAEEKLRLFLLPSWNVSIIYIKVPLRNVDLGCRPWFWHHWTTVFSSSSPHELIEAIQEPKDRGIRGKGPKVQKLPPDSSNEQHSPNHSWFWINFEKISCKSLKYDSKYEWITKTKQSTRYLMKDLEKKVFLLIIYKIEDNGSWSQLGTKELTILCRSLDSQFILASI